MGKVPPSTLHRNGQDTNLRNRQGDILHRNRQCTSLHINGQDATLHRKKLGAILPPLEKGRVVYVYCIIEGNPVFDYFFQTRIGDGGIGQHCGLLCKYKGDPRSVKPNACIQVTISADLDNPIGSSTFRLIRNNVPQWGVHTKSTTSWEYTFTTN